MVHIFDYGVLPEQGSPYFVIEYLEGETLHTRIWRASKQQPGGRLGLSCLNTLRQIALALDAVHRHGLVHRGPNRSTSPTGKLVKFSRNNCAVTVTKSET